MSKLNSLMDKILQILNLNDEARKAFMEEYNILVTKRLSSLFLERISEEKDFNKVFQEISDPPDASKLYDYIDKRLKPEEKLSLVNFCKYTIFLEVLEPILEEASPEEKAMIEAILKSDKDFVDLYDNLKQITPII